MPNFICPNCKERSIDIDRKEGLYDEAVACHHCGFGFLFELMDDYYPAPTTGMLVCDRDGRILAVGRGVYELTGLGAVRAVWAWPSSAARNRSASRAAIQPLPAAVTACR